MPLIKHANLTPADIGSMLGEAGPWELGQPSFLHPLITSRMSGSERPANPIGVELTSAQNGGYRMQRACRAVTFGQDVGGSGRVSTSASSAAVQLSQ